MAWIRKGGLPGRPVVLVDYSPSRAGAVACEILEGFAGYLVCDAYSGYHPLVKAGKVLLGKPAANSRIAAVYPIS